MNSTLLGGVRGEDDLGHPPALVDQRRKDDHDCSDGAEEDEHSLSPEGRTRSFNGEREPTVAAPT
jgi:hypothetical protein